MPGDQGKNFGWSRLIRTLLFFPFLLHGIFSFSSQFTGQDKWAKHYYRRLSFSLLSPDICCVYLLLALEIESLLRDLWEKENQVFLKRNVYSEALLKVFQAVITIKNEPYNMCNLICQGVQTSQLEQEFFCCVPLHTNLSLTICWAIQNGGPDSSGFHFSWFYLLSLWNLHRLGFKWWGK